MNRSLTSTLALCLLACATTKQCGPDPVNPVPDASTGGTAATGGASSSGGTVASGGTTASPIDAGPATGGKPAVVFPACDESRKAKPARKYPLGRKFNRAHAKRKHASLPTEVVVTHDVFWTSNNTQALDQGGLGSCTGNAVAQCLSAKPFGYKLGEATAVKFYSYATTIDPFPGTYPPDDTGSDGASALNASVKYGYLKTWHDAATLAEIVADLMDGPCIIGMAWHDPEFTPNSCGMVDPSGPEVGGHEVVLVGYNAATGEVWMDNSWGNDWGLKDSAGHGGYFKLTSDGFKTVLNEGAEVECPDL